LTFEKFPEAWNCHSTKGKPLAMSADELQDVTVEGLRQDALLGGTKRLVPISSVQPIMVFGLAI
jgi:hypothetical protein